MAKISKSSPKKEKREPTNGTSEFTKRIKLEGNRNNPTSSSAVSNDYAQYAKAALKSQLALKNTDKANGTSKKNVSKNDTSNINDSGSSELNFTVTKSNSRKRKRWSIPYDEGMLHKDEVLGLTSIETETDLEKYQTTSISAAVKAIMGEAGEFDDGIVKKTSKKKGTQKPKKENKSSENGKSVENLTSNNKNGNVSDFSEKSEVFAKKEKILTNSEKAKKEFTSNFFTYEDDTNNSKINKKMSKKSKHDTTKYSEMPTEGETPKKKSKKIKLDVPSNCETTTEFTLEKSKKKSKKCKLDTSEMSDLKMLEVGENSKMKIKKSKSKQNSNENNEKKAKMSKSSVNLDENVESSVESSAISKASIKAASSTEYESAAPMTSSASTESGVDAIINSSYTSKSFKKLMKQTWNGAKAGDISLPHGGGVLQQPFSCAHMPDFLSSQSDLLARLRKQLYSLPMREKNNDMYKFRQTDELPNSGACQELRQFLLGTVRSWLSKVTGAELNDKLALSASLYKHTDTLVCHDDELEGRRVAFILYLTDHEWTEEHGGSLDLFSVDGAGRPAAVCRSLYPRHNSFAFFEVSPVSFHQVREVLSPRSLRLSVNGWFHGVDIPRPPRPSPAIRRYVQPVDIQESTLYSLINPLYLAEALQASIKKQFQRDSEIQLEDFIDPQKYEELSTALREAGPDGAWQWAGPPNRTHYQIAASSALPSAVQLLVQLMRSDAMMLILSQLTGLPLHPLADANDADDDKDSDADDDSDDQDSNDDEQESENENMDGENFGNGDSTFSDNEDDQTLTLGEVVKRHKKQYKKQMRLTNSGNNSSSVDGSNSSCNIKNTLAETWVPDTGIEGSESHPPTEGMARVFTSVRRISHGCYSVILDDDNLATLDSASKDEAGDSSNETGDSNDETGNCSSDDPNDSDTNIDAIDHQKPEQTDKNITKKEKKNATKSAKKSSSSSTAASPFVLDVAFSCNVPEAWDERKGGYTAYVAKGETEELLSITPRSNSLALVYRDDQTFGFLKHVNCSRKLQTHATALEAEDESKESKSVKSGKSPESYSAAAAAASSPALVTGDHFHQIFCQYK